MSIPPLPSQYKGFKLGPPSGFKVLKSPTSKVSAKAKSLLSNKMGDEFTFDIDGVKYFARLEPHYHPPGYKNGPNGWHKGCSVYVENIKQIEEKKPEKSEEQKEFDKKTIKVPEKPKYNFISELDKIVKRLMG